MAYNITVIVYVVVQFILGHRMVCITLFGMKVDCYNKTYLETTEELWAECFNRLNRFHAAQAFAIISILVYFAAFAFGLLLLFCCPCLRWVCLALNVAGILTLCVVWAAMVVTYYTDDSADCVKAKDEFTFGIGFDLLMTAWCLDIIAAILMLFASVMEHDPEGRPRWERGVPCAPVRVAPMQRQDGSSSTTRMWPPCHRA
ncbi:Amastin surface glycofamily protein [Leishmania donovani]|uniref:Amastin surface glycofamily protein n=1 Tax=Leishmania donovani TaxID=5661 RepID=A0A504XYX6_LEIDO|nr:Amastin surface glycofamily protein [Leishmania donovani]